MNIIYVYVPSSHILTTITVSVYNFYINIIHIQLISLLMIKNCIWYQIYSHLQRILAAYIIRHNLAINNRQFD